VGSAINDGWLGIAAAVIVGREIVISALREWMAELGKRASVAVSFIGKVKTAIQMVSITILLACDPQTAGWLLIGGYILLYLAAILTLWSMYMYLKTAWPLLVADKADQT
jgi:CDP-diacylglycerol--glycerol-3-phosphate 3-phosphatidyltransferase